MVDKWYKKAKLWVWTSMWRKKEVQVISKNITNKLCGKPCNMPRPYTPHTAAQLQPIHALRLQHPARVAWCIFMIDRLWLWCRPYKLCRPSDLNSQPKRPGDLDLWPWKWCPSHVGYLCANFSLPRPLCSRELRPMYATDRRQTDRRQTKASLNAPAY